MTRQTKLGIVVAGLFLAAMAGFYGLRIYRAQTEQAAGDETAQTPAPPQPEHDAPAPKQELIIPATSVPAPVASVPTTPTLNLPPATLANDGPGVPAAMPAASPPPAPIEIPKAPDPTPTPIPLPVEQPKAEVKPADAPPPAPLDVPKAPDPTPIPIEPVKPDPKPVDPPAPTPTPAPEPAKPEFKPVDPAPPATPAPEPKPQEPATPPPQPTPINKEPPPPPSPLPLPDSIASGSPVQPTAGTKLAPKPPAVESFLEEEYRIAVNDSFAKISQKFYFSEKYSAALQQYNRDYPVASTNLKQDPPKLVAGQVVWIPPVRILERRYPTLVPGVQPAGSAVAAPAAAAPATPATASWNAAPATPPKPTAKTYRVHDGGETMQDIAKRTLNNANSWGEIYRLNPSLNPGANIIIPAGTLLKLPIEAKTE